jgi:hypothetical protein
MPGLLYPSSAKLASRDEKKKEKKKNQASLDVEPNVGEGTGVKRRTPMQRLRQLEPSWLRKGQTTSLLESVIEKDEVRDDLGGILETPPFDVEGFGFLERGGRTIARDKNAIDEAVQLRA